MRPRGTAVIAVFAVALCVAAPPEAVAHAKSRKQAHAPALPAAIDARPTGTFAMLAYVTSAMNVPGEHVGQSLRRRWALSPESCAESVCEALNLDRERSAGVTELLALRRVAVGTYTGTGSFYVPLRCKNRTYTHGSRAPYRITLTIRSAVTVQDIGFARTITAAYQNSTRSDSTPCVLDPSHDAARYSGSASSAVPTPPVAGFSTQLNGATDNAAFTDTSAPAADGAPIVSTQWSFGDPASGASDNSTEPSPSHNFSGPGVYTVTLTVTDADGLIATSTQQIVVSGPPHAAFAATAQGMTETFAFTDESTPGLDGPAIVSWSWNFGDPGSGSQNTSTEENPSHAFTVPGPHTVTLTVTDGDGLTATTERQVTP